MAGMKKKLTVRSVEAALPGVKDAIIWDSDLTGFGLKVTPAGRRSFFAYYRTGGVQRRPTIGQYPVMRPEAAREIARQWLAGAARGEDASAIRKEARKAATVSELFGRYLTDHADVKKRDSSATNDRRLIEKRIKPALGAKKVPAVTRADIASLHHKLAATPFEANRVLALVSKAFSLAHQWGLRPDGVNPAIGIERYPEPKRERFLSAEETKRLWQTLESPEVVAKNSASAIMAIRLLMQTGRRLSEITTLKWEYLDLEAGVMSLPTTKTGALTVPLSASVVSQLVEWKAVLVAAAAKVAEKGGGRPVAPVYVIPGRSPAQPLVNLQKPWRRIRKAAGLDGVRIHDLRHSFASVAVGLGMSLPQVGKLLGHTQAATTARYAHLSLEVQREAVGLVDKAFGEMTNNTAR